MDWQLGAVIVVQALAVAFLVRRFFKRPPRPKRGSAPDVAVSALVRRKPGARRS